VDVSIKKVGQRDGKERFVLLNALTREVLTVHDVSEASLRSFFRRRGVDANTLDACFQKARACYEQATNTRRKVDNAADTMADNDLLFELGLGGREDR
jgi:hypothetical protein